MKEYTSPAQEHPAAGGDGEREASTLSSVQPAVKSWLRMFSALRQRNFRLYWFGQMISVIGSWMQSIGQAWLVLSLTHSGWQLGLVGALQALPLLLFSLFGGVLADRWPKRRVLLLTQSVALLQALLLWVLIVSGTVQLWHIYVLALLLGLTRCLDMPTSQAFVVELVGREDLPNAVALKSLLTQVARIVGPGLGGLIIAASGVSLLFLLNALSFLAVIAGLALINGHTLYAQVARSERVRKPQSTWQSLREGLLYCWQTPTILLVILVSGLVLLFGANFNVVLPLFATDVLHVGASGFGMLVAAPGLGALLAALWLAWSNQRPMLRHVLLGTLLFSVLEVIFALSHLYPLSIALIAGVGFSETIFAAQAMTTLQTLVPDHLRGRVVGVQILLFDGSVPLGYLLTGWLATLYGPSIALLICALLCLLITGAGLLYARAS